MEPGKAHLTFCRREIRNMTALDSRFRGNDGLDEFAMGYERGYTEFVGEWIQSKGRE